MAAKKNASKGNRKLEIATKANTVPQSKGQSSRRKVATTKKASAKPVAKVSKGKGSSTKAKRRPTGFVLRQQTSVVTAETQASPAVASAPPIGAAQAPPSPVPPVDLGTGAQASIRNTSLFRVVDSVHLANWAGRLTSRVRVAELAKDLVQATIWTPNHIRFPAGEDGELHGFDGHLLAKSAHRFIPDGESVWEFGVAEEPLQKAETDITTRESQLPASETGLLSFVFMTPHVWQAGGAWRSFDSRWKRVQVLDAVALADWIAECPGVALKWAGILQIARPDTLRSVDQFWEDYSNRFAPPLAESVLLAGREHQRSELVQRLGGGAAMVVLVADSEEEALAFLAAVLRTSPEARRVLARTVIAETEDDAAEIRTTNPLLFCIRRERQNTSARLVQRGNTLVVAAGNDYVQREGFLRLNLASTSEFAVALRQHNPNLSDDQAIALARDCGRSPTILQRRLAPAPAEPQWANHRTPVVLIAALLAGAWDAGNEHDRTVLARLSGMSWDSLEQELVHLLQMEDPPVARIGDHWQLRAPVDCFEFIARRVAPSQLATLKAVLTDVFSEIDPSTDLPATERPYASLRGAELRHSKLLRDGLATTLLLIAVRGPSCAMTIENPEAFASQCIAGLAGLSNDVRLIASLRRQLSFIAEATPQVFLKALEDQLSILEGAGASAGVRVLFSDTDAYFPNSPHTELLWALETLGWSIDYLPRVARILCRLTRLDPGGSLSNRPLSSLVSMFVPWRPSTTASPSERAKVLDALVQEFADVSWRLLHGILPRRTGVVIDSPRPRMRDFGKVRTITVEEFNQVTAAVLERALAAAGASDVRATELLELATEMGGEAAAKIINHLQSLPDSASEERTRLWDHIRAEVARQEEFADAEWAFPSELLDALRKTAQRLEPKDPIARVRWLFDSWTLKYSELNSEEADKRREAALAAVLESGGVDAVISLARQAKFPALVGRAVALMSIEEAGQFVRLASAESELGPFVAGVSQRALAGFGGSWVDAVRVLDVPNRVKVAAVLAWPDDSTSWKMIESIGSAVAEEFWRSRQVFFPIDAADTVEAVGHYVDTGRALGALTLIEHQPDSFSLDDMLATTKQAVAEAIASRQKLSTMDAYHLGKILTLLDQKGASESEMVRLELQTLPVLETYRVPKALHGTLARDPAIFVQLVEMVFREEGAPKTEPDERRVRQAEHAFRVLNSWKSTPAETDLEQWVRTARSLGANVKRAAMTDLQIGRVLAHTPWANGVWPSVATAKVIEAVGSDSIEQGIETERFNMRGVVSKSMYEGGGQERALETQHLEWATARLEFTRTSALLRRMAERWNASAAREDLRAQQDREVDSR